MLEPVWTPAAPQAIGPYSQAVRAGKMLFCSGQLGLDHATGELVGPGAKEQTQRALENLRAVLEKGGFSLSEVAKTTVYLQDLSDFQAMNEVYGAFFDDFPPARSTIGVAGLPKQASVEIEAIAIKL